MIGVGQTHHRAKRADVSMAGLLREAVDRALADAQVTFDDIDAIVIGKAPDLFEGVMMPELYLAEALGAPGKPLLRVHTAGSVGGSTAIVAASLVEAGIHERVLTVAFEKQSESNAMWALSIPVPFIMPVHAGAGGYFAPHVRSYIRRSGAPTHIGAIVAAKDRQNALKNPYAHLQNPDTTFESVHGVADALGPDPVRRDVPVVRRRVRPGDRLRGRRGAIGHQEPGLDPRHPDAQRTDHRCRARPGQPARRTRGRGGALEAGRHPSPIDEIDCAEIYVPFSWFEPMWLENLGFAEPGDGWKLTEAGETAIGGRIPVNMSGGVLSSNPIGAAACCASARPRSRSWARPASTRSTVPARPSATRTAAAPSSSRCGSSAPTSQATELVAQTSRRSSGGQPSRRSQWGGQSFSPVELGRPAHLASVELGDGQPSRRSSADGRNHARSRAG